uniref:Uncharacterized protein n=1 Tax=Timema poppense TaxID=170557 RepID=A0A7R9DK52_TIMPO|nr:unnamed protein product [Timema poppensis]
MTDLLGVILPLLRPELVVCVCDASDLVTQQMRHNAVNVEMKFRAVDQVFRMVALARTIISVE